MKTIDGLLNHINKLTKAARHGHESDRDAKEQLSEAKDGSHDSNTPKSVKHGINHISNALKSVEDAENSMKSSDSQLPSAADQHKKKMIAAKMKALQDQIKNDFQKVTGFGNKAGYLPPVKMPHM